ncbi:DUF2637 domain-containing protein [Streptomyces sp. NBC_00198]|uniref:DUF2637 domain-containing protein n=1 Tax=Streptomyces sp. NBC_00198 TaxID=2975677 RepID=UPI002253EAC7|nr:DUF2637 domain-containing protein [Streptomyces sp. NBC_00198]MCX5285936.1 DUF2637 domain-containing protein [Streptomyces sp. NBC_00198]MCX5286245.1 DUF2637 domain-containing protein [Streptomyces sp. NBC_00198]
MPAAVGRRHRPAPAGQPVSGAADTVSTTDPAVSTAGPSVSTTAAPVSGAARAGLNVFAIIGGLALAAIGFTGSYRALVKLGQDRGFGDFAWVFPIGVDVGIVVLYALDLVLTHRRIRWPILRLAAHAFTAATIFFNASSGDKPWRDDLVGVGMHAVIPVMFVAAVETARRIIIQITRTEDAAAGTARDGIPRERWLLSPVSSFLMFRRMVINEIHSYSEAVDRRRDLLIYRAALDRAYPKGKWYRAGWKSAPMDERLPLILEPYGLTVDEALAIPQQARDEEKRRAQADTERQEDEELQAELRAGDHQILRLNKQAEIAEAREKSEARASVATVASRTAYSKASAVAEAEERVAVQEAEALESAVAAAAAKQAAEDRLAAAAASEEAAQAEERAAAARRTAALTERDTARALAEKTAADEEAAQATKRAAETRAAAVETQRRTAETQDQLTEEQHAAATRALEDARLLEEAAAAEQRASEIRRATAETERRAAETEAAAAETRARAAETAAEAAAVERSAAADREAAAAAHEAAVETRARAAETERRAVEAEHEARLKPTERDARKVARMILTDGAGDPEAVDLNTIANVLSVAVSTASERRREAAQLIASGYQLPESACLTP